MADLTPQQRVAAECRRRGKRAVVDGCARLVRGDYTDAGLITALGREGAAKFFDGREHEDTYWFRVWGARGRISTLRRRRGFGLMAAPGGRSLRRSAFPWALCTGS